MNRTDRLYAIVELLRARAPATMTARELAERFEVSRRTIERDIAALQQAGTPIWSDVGRRGGLGIDPAHTLPPINLTVDEALAVAIALGRDDTSPFADAGRSALLKLAAVMPADARADARRVTDRIQLLDTERAGDGDAARRQVLDDIRHAVVHHRVVDLEYVDVDGRATRREVEPIGLVANRDRWYLVGWCRRREAVRAFRLDRASATRVLDEAAAPRPFVLDDALRAVARRPNWS